MFAVVTGHRSSPHRLLDAHGAPPLSGARLASGASQGEPRPRAGWRTRFTKVSRARRGETNGCESHCSSEGSADKRSEPTSVTVSLSPETQMYTKVLLGSKSRSCAKRCTYTRPRCPHVPPQLSTRSLPPSPLLAWTSIRVSRTDRRRMRHITGRDAAGLAWQTLSLRNFPQSSKAATAVVPRLNQGTEARDDSVIARLTAREVHVIAATSKKSGPGQEDNSTQERRAKLLHVCKSRNIWGTGRAGLRSIPK